MRVEFLEMSQHTMFEIYTESEIARQIEFSLKKREALMEVMSNIPSMKERVKEDWKPRHVREVRHEVHQLLSEFSAPASVRLYNEVMFWVNNNSIFDEDAEDRDDEQEPWYQHTKSAVQEGYATVLDLIIKGNIEQAFITSREYEHRFGEMWCVDTSAEKYLDVVFIDE